MPIDYSKYPPNWKTEIVPAIRKRSGDKCECCGLKNKQEVYSTKFQIKCEKTGRYKWQTVWFSNENDIIREARHCQGYKKVKVVLTTAHLDHDETNWNVSLDRLKHLCQICHLRYDAIEKFKRKNEQTNP